MELTNAWKKDPQRKRESLKPTAPIGAIDWIASSSVNKKFGQTLLRLAFLAHLPVQTGSHSLGSVNSN